ncbi:O-Methyltransferase involved in polyketide biosynthesis [Streptomyces sp. WMMB 714]|uniref:SAM-dependent methyltransferase n=1 Tax=Streptomyces sp. WMMB 714 TaxID=1286822 RepID=UPI0005F7898E|nr:SAM-dependent methyltransferase [Streptomyces sp. WMMB 714]SCK55704.1 O-Methyltransferase involved in polyketide biosynthesis [Streptomyces sp. WMMB 714]
MTGSGAQPPPIDTGRAHSARMYDYYLGGKDWYPVDREAAEKVKEVFPFIVTGARANRDFMHRATRTLAAEYGVRQFIDIGTGIPTSPNLHQVAQEAAPEARVVYADNDPTVLEYTDALTLSHPRGRTAYVHADLRHDDVLEAPRLRATVDLEEPVALSLLAVTHFLPDEYGPYEIVRSMVERLAPGSFLVLSHATPDFNPAAHDAVAVYRQSGTPAQIRTRAEIERFFDGTELIEPGLTSTHRWRPEGDSGITDADAFFYAGIGRKP